MPQLFSAIDEDAITMDATEAKLALVSEHALYEAVRNNSISGISTIIFNHLMDDEGTFYRALELKVDARWFDADGNLWVAGGPFSVNYTILSQDRTRILERYLAKLSS